MNQAFHDYATRVSFNLTLTRNQIAAFEHVVHDIKLWELKGKLTTFDHMNDISRFVPAVKKLGEMGLVIHTDPGEMNPKWSRCVWTLTPAGSLVWQLLREAGLVHDLVSVAA